MADVKNQEQNQDQNQETLNKTSLVTTSHEVEKTEKKKNS